MDMLTKIKTVMSSPEKFFKGLKEKEISSSYKYFAILNLLGVLLVFISDKLFYGVKYTFIENFAKDYPFALNPPTIGQYIAGYLFSLVFIFVIVGILHVWIKIFRGKAKYQNTFQVFTYGSTPSFLFAWVPIIGSFIWIYDLVLLIIGTSVVHKMSKTKATVLYIIPMVILFALIILLLAAIFALLVTLYTQNPELFNNITQNLTLS